MKKIYLLTLIGVIFTFGAGFLTARMIYHQPTKEFCLSIPQANGSESYFFEEDKCITNLNPNDELDLNYLWFLLSSAPKIEDEVIIENRADYWLLLRSTKTGTDFINKFLWITEEGATIGDKDFESNAIKNTKFISPDTLDYLSNFIKRHK